MSNEAYRWHYDYTRIAWDTGFCFDSHKTQKAFDRNGIALLDIERIIRERDIGIVEHHIQNILEYSLETEETRILDPNFVKLFRLSQLAVEYLTYCKKYLDSTVTVIKQDLQKANDENDELKKDLINYQLEASKLKKKVKDLKSTLLIHQKYQSVGAFNEPAGVFQCNECSKVFINDEYLKAHILRRHPSIDSQQALEVKITETLATNSQINTTPVHTQYKAETDRLQMEIKELKEKLNSTERYFKNEEEAKKANAQNNESSQQSEEYYKHIEKLHQQFELLKTQIESEVQVLKVQKSEQDKYETLIEKFFDKLDVKHTTANEPAQTTEVTEKIEVAEPIKPIIEEQVLEPVVHNAESNTQTGTEIPQVEQKQQNLESIETVINIEASKDEEKTAGASVTVSASPQKQMNIPRLKETTTRFIKITDSPVKSDTSITDIVKVKEEIGKKLEEKTKQDIEKLGEQLSGQMSNTFLKLQERLETFWNKLQEIEVQRENQQQALLNVQESVCASNLPKPSQQISTASRPRPTETISNESSDLESDTESSKFARTTVEIHASKPTVISAYKESNMPINLVAELKTKVQEINKSKIKVDNTISSKSVLQKPVVKEIFSRPITEFSSESESESVTESETESDTPVETKPSKTITNSTVNNRSKTVTDGGRSVNTSTLQNRSIKSLENALLANPEILENFREEMEDVVANRLRDLGVDPEWTRLPEKAYKHKLDIVTHHRSLAAKKIKSFIDIRNEIIENVEEKVQYANQPDSKSPESESKTSKFKSIILNMKNKAKSIMKTTEKAPTPSPKIYKLTIQKSPQLEQRETIKQKTLVKPRTIQRKTKINENMKQKMYESDSDNTETMDKPNKEMTQIKPVPVQRKTLRKSKSESSMEVADSTEKVKENQPITPITNMARSLSTLDSILEMKKEIFALQNTPQAQDKHYSSSSESIASDREEVIAVSPRIQIPKHADIEENQNAILNAIATEKSKIELSSSDLDTDDLKDDKAHKGVLKNFGSTGALVKKKVLFDLHSEDVKTVSESPQDEQQVEIKNIQRMPVKKTLVKSNSLFNSNDLNGSSTSIDSSILDLNKKSSKQTVRGTGDTISTKAVINVSAKSHKTHDDISDWDISDIN